MEHETPMPCATVGQSDEAEDPKIKWIKILLRLMCL